jgi:hypothetical protein
MQTGLAQKGKIPKLDDILEDSDEEPEPDVVVDVPHHKVKLVVGPGGDRIRLIERKSKARLQVSCSSGRTLPKSAVLCYGVSAALVLRAWLQR